MVLIVLEIIVYYHFFLCAPCRFTCCFKPDVQHHRDDPFVLRVGNHDYSVKYEAGESESNLFGGNSNWRGPIWFPCKKS